MKKTTFKSLKSILAARLVSKKMSFKSQPKFAGWRSMLLLSIIGIVGCNSELNDAVEIAGVENVKSLDLDYSVIAEAYSNVKLSGSESQRKTGVDDQLETKMIEYLNAKYPEKNYKKEYEELVASNQIKTISYIALANSRVENFVDIKQDISDLQLSKPAEAHLINLTHRFDKLLDESNESYNEKEAVDYIKKEVELMKSAINSDFMIPIHEKQLLIEAMKAYVANIPILVNELAIDGAVNSRLLGRILRFVVTVAVNITVGVLTGLAFGPSGPIIGGVVGLVVGVYMVANNQCFAFDRCSSGRMSCQTGACY